MIQRQIKSAQRTVFIRVVLYSLLSSITAYIHSSYLISAGLLQNQIDSVYILLSVGGIISVWFLAIRKRSIAFFARAIIVFSILLTLSLVTILATPAAVLLIIAIFILLGLESSMFFSYDELLEHVTTNTSTAKTRSVYLMLQNTCWIIAPLIGFNLIEHFSEIKVVYFIGLLLATVLTIYSIRSLQHTPQESLSIAETNKPLNKYVLPAIYSHFVLQVFYACMISITPIYLHEVLGWSWSKIGIIIATALLAFPLVQFPLGKFLDESRCEKMLMPVSMIIIGLSIVAFIVTQHAASVIFPILTLFFTRVGAASLEIANESYIFRHINYRHRSTIATFRSLSPLSYLFVPIFWLLITRYNMQTLLEILAGFVLTSSLIVLALFILRDNLKIKSN